MQPWDRSQAGPGASFAVRESLRQIDANQRECLTAQDFLETLCGSLSAAGLANGIPYELVESRARDFEAKDLACQCSYVLAEGLDVGPVRVRGKAFTMHAPNTASRNLLEHDGRMCGDDRDAVAINDQVRERPDE